MTYLVILKKLDNNNFLLATINEKSYTIQNSPITANEKMIASLASNNADYKLLNFSLDRNGKIKEDVGSFTRLGKNTGIVLAEIKNVSGRTLGYRIINNTTFAISNMKTEDIVVWDKKLDVPFLQNGIIRNNTVNCYPLHSFPILQLDGKKPARIRKSINTLKQSSPKVKEPLVFSDKQKNEIKVCRSKGIDSRFIENPKLSPQQMRVLWASKMKGAYSEYFANPEISVEAMKFYADHLDTKQMVKECSRMLQSPQLEPEELAELYLCICEGVDYTPVINKQASDIASYRYENSTFRDKFDTDISDDMFEKALGVARKIKGYN